jgi:hypothetical protein
MEVIRGQLDGLDDASVNKLVSKNATDFYGFG